jgi:hypothetical protein
MIHEHEATQLASAAIDFTLSPDTLQALDEELRDCPVCAERAAAYREQIHLMQRLPILDASDATRRKVTAAAMGGTASSRSPMMLLLAAALLLLLLVAMTAAAGALLQNRKPQDLLADAPSASPGAITALETSAPSNAPTDAAGGVFPDRLALGSLAEVVETNVRVRSQPRVAADSTRLAPFLQPGDRLFIADGPVVADNYDWYEVVPIGTGPSRPGSDLPTGWVARGDHDAQPWIKPVEPNCPATPVDIARLSSMHRLERLACFGNTPLSFSAIVEGGRESDWTAKISADAPAAPEDMALAIRPSAKTKLPTPGPRAMDLVGAFDDPSCQAGGQTTPIAALSCRARFVATEATEDPANLSAGDAAITTTDNLRIRTLPVVDDASGKLELLPLGTHLGIVGGPAVGSGYVWYQVAVPSIRTPADAPRTGWVAAHSTDGEPWVGADDLSCPPPGGVSVADLARLTSAPIFHGGPVCYGRDAAIPGAELTVNAFLRRGCAASTGTPSTWLMDPGRVVVLNDGTAEARAVLADDAIDRLDCGGASRRTRFNATGHFDDRAAVDCRSAGIEPAAAVYECRSRFVITDLQAVGPRVP